MLESLLKHGLEMRDCLLQAINEDNVEATQIILKHQKIRKLVETQQNIKIEQECKQSNINFGERSKSEELLHVKEKITRRWRKLASKKISQYDSNKVLEDSFYSLDNGRSSYSSCFTPDITPIILAAQKDNYEITKILLDRGDTIWKPHDIRCGCDDCVQKSAEDNLNLSMSRINAYRALASPSLMALTSKDPILTAFELSLELRRLSQLENELKLEYEALSKQCQNFAVELLDQVRGSKELEVILNYDKHGPLNSGDRMCLARLKLAIKYKQKKFVSHPNCQQLLASIWYEGLLGFRRRHIIFKVLLTMLVFLLFPILSLIYIIAPKSSAGQFMRRPFIKFICHSASYITFLVFLILASQRIDSIINITNREINYTKTIREIRGQPPTSIEWIILAYVAGLIWSEIKQLWDQGIKSYVQDMWNILDFITNSLYIATYTLKLVSYLKVQNEKRDITSSTPYVARENWDAYDPTLISEGLFASANIFSCLKLIYIFTVSPHLGPLQISLGRMVIDILKFLFIALLVCFSYSCGVNQLYWSYAEVKSRDCNECEIKNVRHTAREKYTDCHALCDRSIANLFEIIQTLYFAIYGLVELNKFELKENHIFTQFVGKLMFGTYLGIMTIVLINMLIAMLSGSFQKISDDGDTEWKFARSKLWMSYFEEGGTVPAPFNIIPTAKSSWYLIKWITGRLCKCTNRAKTSKWHNVKKATKKMLQRDIYYQSVISELVKRYIMNRQKKSNQEGVTEDDVNEIKQDLSSFRYELINVLKNNGMNVPLPTTNHMYKLRRRNSKITSLDKLCNNQQSTLLSYSSSDASINAKNLSTSIEFLTPTLSPYDNINGAPLNNTISSQNNILYQSTNNYVLGYNYKQNSNINSNLYISGNLNTNMNSSQLPKRHSFSSFCSTICSNNQSNEGDIGYNSLIGCPADRNYYYQSNIPTQKINLSDRKSRNQLTRQKSVEGLTLQLDPLEECIEDTDSILSKSEEIKSINDTMGNKLKEMDIHHERSNSDQCSLHSQKNNSQNSQVTLNNCFLNEDENKVINLTTTPTKISPASFYKNEYSLSNDPLIVSDEQGLKNINTLNKVSYQLSFKDSATFFVKNKCRQILNCKDFLPLNVNDNKSSLDKLEYDMNEYSPFVTKNNRTRKAMSFNDYKSRNKNIVDYKVITLDGSNTVDSINTNTDINKDKNGNKIDTSIHTKIKSRFST